MSRSIDVLETLKNQFDALYRRRNGVDQTLRKMELAAELTELGATSLLGGQNHVNETSVGPKRIKIMEKEGLAELVGKVHIQREFSTISATWRTCFEVGLNLSSE